MREKEREKIRRNLWDLVLLTTCSDQLLAYLLQKGILIDDEVETIISKSTRSAQAKELYTIIQRKCDEQRPFHHLLVGMKKTIQRGVVEILQDRTSQWTGSDGVMVKREKECHSGIQFDVWRPVKEFTGRREELEELHAKLQMNSEPGYPQITSISGLGGIGKTQLARRYIYEHSTDYGGNVIWFRAENTETLSNLFFQLAKNKLGISTWDDRNEMKVDIKTVVGKVYEWFSSKKCLYVFDNAEAGDYIRDFLPQSQQDGTSILITTRETKFNRECAKNFVELREMKINESINFMRMGLADSIINEKSDEAIKSLCTRLQCFPLALQQAVSYIKEQNELEPYTIQNYLDEFEKNEGELLDSGTFKGMLNDYERTTFRTWKMTVDKISATPDVGNLSLMIFYFMAYLLPDNIHLSVLLSLLPSKEEREVKRAVLLLINYSMINRTEDKHSSQVSIHRLVQDVTRLELVSIEREEACLFLLCEGIEISILEGPYGDHSFLIWSYASRYANLVKCFFEVPLLLTRYLSEMNRFAEAYSFAVNAKRTLEQHLPLEHQGLFVLEYVICDISVHLGKLKESQIKITELLGRASQMSQMSDFELHCKITLAKIFHETKKYEKALELYLDAIKEEEDMTEEWKWNNKLIRHRLPQRVASCYEKLGNHEKALEYYVLALENCPQFSADAVDYSMLVADMKEKLGRREEAENLRKSLREMRTMQSTDVKIKSCLKEAIRLFGMRDNDGVLQSCEEGLLNGPGAIGTPGYLDLLWLQLLKGVMLREKGDLEEACELHTRVYNEFLGLYGEDEDERSSLIAKAELGLTFAKQGKKVEATRMEVSGMASLRKSPDIFGADKLIDRFYNIYLITKYS